VLIGGNATGTPGPINQVTGTLVCNPGTGAQRVLNSAPVGLSPRGNALSRPDQWNPGSLCEPGVPGPHWPGLARCSRALARDGGSPSVWRQ